METRQLGSLWPVDARTFGAAVVGQEWFEITLEQCVVFEASGSIG